MIQSSRLLMARCSRNAGTRPANWSLKRDDMLPRKTSPAWMQPYGRANGATTPEPRAPPWETILKKIFALKEQHPTPFA
jgi:hypothetical protein